MNYASCVRCDITITSSYLRSNSPANPSHDTIALCTDPSINAPSSAFLKTPSPTHFCYLPYVHDTKTWN